MMNKLNTQALKIAGLNFSYPNNPSVLRDISMEVSPGERVGIIGPNGAGKSTLFLVVCGILKPDSGQVLVFSRPVIQGRFNPDVALVFQRSDDQLFCPSVREDVAFGPENMGLDSKEVEARVEEALSIVNALELSSRPVHHLSEGEKRIVSIAGALAMNPKVIIYDEPSASLDIRSRRRLISILQKSEKTILIASHDLELILEVCTRVVIINSGKIIAQGIPAEVMGDEELMLANGQEKPHSLVPHLLEHKH